MYLPNYFLFGPILMYLINYDQTNPSVIFAAVNLSLFQVNIALRGVTNFTLNCLDRFPSGFFCKSEISNINFALGIQVQTPNHLDNSNTIHERR